MSTPTRPPITCHVLDTVTGRPAAGVTVKLWCTHQQDIIFIANTNQDGRVAEWENKQGPGETTSDYVQNRGGVNATMCSVIERFAKREEGAQADSRYPPKTSMWRLQFDTGAHYGVGNTFFPVVELTFLVKPDEHFHVPLLLGPYSFTTYRGS